MKRIGLAGIFFSVLFLLSFSVNPDAVRKGFAELITSSTLEKHLSEIASDRYEGRATGEQGQKMAAAYIADQFKQAGIPELPGGGYYQKVPLIKYTPGEGSFQAGTSLFSFGTDFFYLPGMNDVQYAAKEMIYAGYGIKTEKYNDYAKLDVKGKTVIIFEGEPFDKNGNAIITGKKEPTGWTNLRRQKIQEARNQGAALLLVVVHDYEKRYNELKHSIETPTLQLDLGKESKEKENLPVLFISEKIADQLLSAAGKKYTAASLEKKKKKKGSVIPAQHSVNITRKSEKIESENVCGYIEGSDLKDEVIVITAHYDHIGKEGEHIYNGADDDGSGTVAVVELARAFAAAKKAGHGPRRSILFMTVTGEERGLLGSKWYTENPMFPLSKTVCDLNIDMIGRVDKEHLNDSNYVYVIGSEKISTELKKINEEANATYVNLKLDYRFDNENDPNRFYYRSDHYNFARKGVPVAFFFNGVHEDYHKETDEVSKISFRLMEVRTRLVFFTAWEIANRTPTLIRDKK
ncbi:MAG: hypothetical protein Fur0041_01030 [Bacteroidia bacterium]